MDKKNIVRDGIILSPNENLWEPKIPKGSFYKTVAAALNSHLNEFGDWNLYTNCITKEVLKASEFEVLAKKWACSK